MPAQTRFDELVKINAFPSVSYCHNMRKHFVVIGMVLIFISVCKYVKLEWKIFMISGEVCPLSQPTTELPSSTEGLQTTTRPPIIRITTSLPTFTPEVDTSTAYTPTTRGLPGTPTTPAETVTFSCNGTMTNAWHVIIVKWRTHS